VSDSWQTVPSGACWLLKKVVVRFGDFAQLESVIWHCQLDTKKGILSMRTYGTYLQGFCAG